MNFVLISLFNEHPTNYFGGEGGIRTLDAGLPHTPLAGERFQPLSHLSERGIVDFLS